MPNPVGRPEYQPTEEHREIVKAMVACGVPVQSVSDCLNLSKKTLYKYYSEEIRTSHILANQQVAQSLFAKATHANVTGASVAAAIFWLKCQAGWKELSGHVPTDPSSAYIPVMFIDTEEDLQKYNEMIGRTIEGETVKDEPESLNDTSWDPRQV